MDQLERRRNGKQTSVSADELGSPDQILQTISSVQKQQGDILEKLHNERLSIEQELSSTGERIFFLDFCLLFSCSCFTTDFFILIDISLILYIWLCPLYDIRLALLSI